MNNTSLHKLMLAIGVLLIALAAHASSQDERPFGQPDGRQILVELEAVDDSQLIRLQAAIRIQAPRELVWNILVDCEQALQYVPDIRECRVIESGEDAAGQPFDITLHRLKPYFFLPSVNNIFRAEYHEPESIKFYREAGDLESFEGAWRFQPACADETVLYYQATVNLNKHLGQSGEMRILEQDIPKMLGTLRQLAEAAFEGQADKCD